MGEREERIGLNEAVFREVNERVRAVSEGFRDVLDEAEFVCECADRDCAERLALTLADYERVRSDATLFIVKPGHEAADVERVVERLGSCVVVKKLDEEAARTARELDPRS